MTNYKKDEEQRQEKERLERAKKIAETRVMTQSPQYDPTLRYDDDGVIQSSMVGDPCPKCNLYHISEKHNCMPGVKDIPKVHDSVNHPSHYTNGSIECLSAIRASMSDDQYIGYLKGVIMKYIWRMDLKGNAIEDLKKGKFYLNELIKVKQEDDLLL